MFNASVPTQDILSGGPPRDGIPAILKPKFTSATEASFMHDEDLVLGFSHRTEARAYPIKILNWHELVNDTVGDKKILVSYCPLCATGMIFDRVVGGKERTFGVSGLLYQSDVLMYDHQTESLWSQLKTEAIAGKSVGERLMWLPSSQMTWRAWREAHLQTLVLSTETGHRRDYHRDPYAGYERAEATMFPVLTHNQALPSKELVAGIIVNGQPKAYRLSGLRGEFEDSVAGQKLRVTYDSAAKSISIRDEAGGFVPVVIAYWFAWQAFYSNTSLYGSAPVQD